MARKITNLETNRDVTKVAALFLVRHQIYEWVEHNVSIRRCASQPARIRQEFPVYIPPGLPPAEVSGCHFQLPTSPIWRSQHRVTVLGMERL